MHILGSYALSKKMLVHRCILQLHDLLLKSQIMGYLCIYRLVHVIYLPYELVQKLIGITSSGRWQLGIASFGHGASWKVVLDILTI